MPSEPTRWPAKTVRDTFLNFYNERNHVFVPSSSVIPHNDPSLLFTNAGMNQYKSIFLGTVDPNADFAHLKRATNSQKCIRAGGKHNDLDDREAIEYSWDLLIRVFELDASRLYVTYFEGSSSLGLHPDSDAKQLWRQIGVPDDHILPGNMKNTFWEMGRQGPCGPCSEVHYDRIGDRNAAHLVNMDDPNVVEIWNIVFGKTSNYDTDLWIPLFEKIQDITGARPYQVMFGADDDGIDTAYRVVADHARTCTIAISDGAILDSVGRGYVIRRILRRGVRYARKYLNAEIGSFFSKIIPTVVEQLGDIFPEVRVKEELVKQILNDEEHAFALTLDRGEAISVKYAQKCHHIGSKIFREMMYGAFTTHGFLIDLTKLMAEEQGLNIDLDEVSAAQENPREASKAALENMPGLKRTDDTSKYIEGPVRSIIRALYYNKSFVDSTSDVPNDARFGILLEKTNFYAESGGQIYDTGRFIIAGVAEMTITNVQSYGGYVLHTGYLKYGVMNVADMVTAEIHQMRRQPVRLNHTGTHILNFALREILGPDVHQKGSLVTPEKLRFDFSLKSGLSEIEIQKLHKLSRQAIEDDQQVFVADVALGSARQIESIRTIPGETYPDPTRVVSVGVPVNTLLANVFNKDWWKYSVEFCGGTHVERTSEIEDLVIIDESGISKGIRRIVAVTGQAAYEARQNVVRLEERLVSIESMDTSPAKETLARQTQTEMASLPISLTDRKQFTKRLEECAKRMIKEQKEIQKLQLEILITSPNETAFVFKIPVACSARSITEAIKYVASNHDDKSVYFIGIDATGKRVSHECFVAPVHASYGLIANEWTAEVANFIGGKTGGKGTTSVGNGAEEAKIEDGLTTARMYLENLKI
ncbi:alanyl-tRNA synthetase [Penicillium malachiteum]|uniref:alanyl-tRNA synthetase n=1 Tax=Penicillium malachiteum TaxID=1324776 RepID=UPI002548B202|nr:alanyl-tRNA synthetase [Penicillium malachiteum]KAJ5713453.1 alanyl-tRNA synthetase [Penicillium malachiteum]